MMWTYKSVNVTEADAFVVDESKISRTAGKGIRTETNGGAWCPKTTIQRDSYEYLQIDLGGLTVLTMVEIQGRFGNGQGPVFIEEFMEMGQEFKEEFLLEYQKEVGRRGQEFTEEFLLEYQREDGGEWMRFRNKRGEERFEGNENTYSAELREVSPPIIGKRVRFIPYCRSPRTVCLRVEMYGCPWTGQEMNDLYPGEDTYGINRISQDDDGLHKTEEQKPFEEQYIGIIIGALAFLIVVLFAIVMFIVIRHKKRKHNNNRLGMKPVVDHVTINMSNVNALHGKLGGKMSNGSMYKGVPTDELDAHICNGGDKVLKGYSDPKDSIQGRNLPDLPSSSELQDCRDYAVPDVTKSALKVALPPVYPPQVPTLRGATLNQLDLAPPTYDALYAAADVVNHQGLNIPNLQGATGNSVYSIPNAELLLSIELSVVEFPRENLRFVEVLGEGQFGEVHLCEAADIGEYLHDDYTMARNANRPVLVAVKMLRKGADDRASAG
ncbi:DDRA-like protein [Mya arenaria]|uniref:DDRA-like protein n=1 Tax=Mya arenaria TaxID=6604 RepID=A0ABY7GA37_MYAAR|nr:DDRA-like protein [Mya arenaria]